MKKIIIALLVVLFFLSFNSCDSEDENDTEKITDVLKISTWVLDESLEGTGYWAYNDTPDDFGYWVSDDGGQLTADEVFKYERIELGKPRVIAPMGFKYRFHVNLHLDFDGIVEVDVGEEGNEYVRLVHSLDYPEEPWRGGGIQENQFRAIAPLTIAINPIGKFVPNELQHRDTLIDREYYLNVRTYDLDGTQIITAKLKLTVLEDKAYPYEDIYFPIYGPSEERSRFLSVELIEYDFSDKYKFEQGLVDTE